MINALRVLSFAALHLLSAECFAAEFESESFKSKILDNLWANQHRLIKNECEMGKGPKTRLGTFLSTYFSWSITHQEKGRVNFNCLGSNPKTKNCEIKFGEFDQGDAHMGWDLILAFTCNEKAEINWASVTCNAVP